MVSKAAKTTFEAGPIDKVKTGDPNKIATNTPDNLLPSSESSTGLGLSTLRKLTGTSTNLDLVKSLQGNLDAGALNPDKLKANLKKFGSNITKNFTNGLEDLSGQMLTNALKSSGWVDDATAKNLFGDDGKLDIADVKAAYKGIKMVVDDTEAFIKNADFKSVSGISKIISDLTGTPGLAKVLDISTELSVLKFVNDLATEWGVTKLADKLLGTLPDDKSKQEFATQMLPSAINSGHLENIELALDQLGVHAVIAKHPNIISDILKNYRYPIHQYNATTTDAMRLLETLNRINSRWYLYNRTGADIYDISTLSRASHAALDTLALNPLHKHAALLMQKRRLTEKTIMDIAATYYNAIFKM